MSDSPSIVLYPSALAPFIADPTPAQGILIDVEPCQIVDGVPVANPAGDTFCLVLRSHDKAVVGKIRPKRDGTPGPTPTLRFCDETGTPRPLVIASGDEQTMNAIASELLVFYTTPDETPDRADLLASAAKGKYSLDSLCQIAEWCNAQIMRLPGTSLGREVFKMVAPVFGLEPLNKNGWKTGSYAELLGEYATERAAKEAEARKQLEKAARILNNAEALRALIAPSTAGAPQVDMASIVKTLLAGLNVNSSAVDALLGAPAMA